MYIMAAKHTFTYCVLLVCVCFNSNARATNVVSETADLKRILLNFQNIIINKIDNLEMRFEKFKEDLTTDVGLLNSTIADMKVACEGETGQGIESRPLSETNSDRIDRVSVRIQDLESRLDGYIRQLDSTSTLTQETMCQTSPSRRQESSAHPTTTTAARQTDTSTTMPTPNQTQRSTSRDYAQRTSTKTTQTQHPTSSVRTNPTRTTPLPSQTIGPIRQPCVCECPLLTSTIQPTVSTGQPLTQTPTTSGTRSTHFPYKTSEPLRTTKPLSTTTLPVTTAPPSMTSQPVTTTTPITSTIPITTPPITTTIPAPACNGTDPIYKHLKEREAFRLTGYFPTNQSGVTIATGVDLGQQSESGLRALGIDDAIIKKLRPYLGLKTKADVEGGNLVASNLKLTEEEACALDKPFLDKAKSIVKPYGTKMTDKGKAVLVSLRHWAGALGNSKADGKLAVTVGNKVKNFVWDTVKGKTATDSQLKAALEKTLPYHTPKTGAYNRIKHEISYLSK